MCGDGRTAGEHGYHDMSRIGCAYARLLGAMMLYIDASCHVVRNTSASRDVPSGKFICLFGDAPPAHGGVIGIVIAT